jgi:F-type H+-transporting ATPase subunit a
VAEEHSPLHQFVVTPLKHMQLGQYDVSFTNSSLMMVLTVAAIVLFLGAGIRGRSLVPGRWQSMVEMSYLLVANQVKDSVGREGQRYFPIVFTLFMFVLFGNLMGMLPYSFTFTSHIIVTFALAMFIFLGVTLIALFKHGFKFFGYFMPKGVPIIMAPLLIVIEVFAYLARPVSLSIRLAANMMAGHTMMKVMAGFVVSLGFLLGWAPLAMLFVLTGFEIFVAFLQAYIFTVLTCVYLHDALHLH